MNKKNIILIIVALLILIGLAFFFSKPEEAVAPQIKKEQETSELERHRELARDWVTTNSPTYLFDGSDLELFSEEKLTDEKEKFVFSFTSSASGHGNRTGEMLAQVITPHQTEVIVENGEVISVVTDRVFDEMKGEILEKKETMTVDLYFVETFNNQEDLVKVEREIPQTEAVGKASIEELLKGPSSEEKEKGFYSALNEGVELQSIEIEDGTAKLDFNQKLQEGIAGSAWVETIREQIRKTISQFETVDEVIISINGQTEGILQP